MLDAPSDTRVNGTRLEKVAHFKYIECNKTANLNMKLRYVCDN